MEEYDNCGLYCQWIQEMHAGTELAILEINNRSDILPDTMVNILRVQGWDSNNIPGGSVGGAAVVALEVVTKHPEVIGVIGDTQDPSTMLSAGVFSQFKIPMCGSNQNIPLLSDKNNYPYFFRVTFNYKFGQDIVKLLKMWKVKRVAIVHNFDDAEASGACADIRNALYSNGFIILTHRYYHGYAPFVDFGDIAREIKRVDARYIIHCDQAWSASYNFVLDAK
ncbi:UNVERIFIED_CONTAM: hypothetical protein HDU68_000735 [Siphonaria sp. JEL0065]|nr:hypothetical protein HDU68_000735 [Siphonaria sp. JEL0065]